MTGKPDDRPGPLDEKTRTLVGRLQALLKLDYEQACRAAGVDSRRPSGEDDPPSDETVSGKPPR